MRTTGMREGGMDGFQQRRPGAGLVVGTFLYVWLMVGFFTGTVVLVGPVKWITGAVRAAGWTQGWEDALLKGVILTFVVGSLFATRWLVGRMWRARPGPLRAGIPVVATALAGLCVWAWMDPGRMLASVGGGDGGHYQSATGAQFLFGAYPDRDALKLLKAQGITAVVSLQHPAVVPFEPRSIAEEERNAKELGITFIHIPMLPWVSDNADAAAKLRQLALKGKGRFYVHCGLGRDRTNVAMRIIEAAGADVKATGSLHHASTLAERTTAFEHGAVYRLDDGVWLVPRPNNAEAAGYMLAGQQKTVVSLLEPRDPQQRAWADEITRELATGGVTVQPEPVRAGETKRAETVVRLVRALPHPVVVIAPHTQWDHPYPGTEPADLFRETYARMTGKPLAPPINRVAPSEPAATTPAPVAADPDGPVQPVVQTH